MGVAEMNRQQEYDFILKQNKDRERKPVDKWFLDYCKAYRLLYERIKGE